MISIATLQGEGGRHRSLRPLGEHTLEELSLTIAVLAKEAHKAITTVCDKFHGSTLTSSRH